MRYSYWQGTTFAPNDLGFGAPYAQVHEGVVEADNAEEALALLFRRHNVDDRPLREDVRSMSVGDVVVLEGTAYRCRLVGFEVWPSFAQTSRTDDPSSRRAL